jgi:hypothetical protein
MSAFVVSPKIGGKFDYLLAAVAVFYGEIALIDSDGYATYGQIITGMVCKGVFEDSCDNSAGDPGDKSVAIQTGWDAEGGKILIPLKNASGGNAVDQADVGRSVFVFDKNTVSGTSNGNTRVRAGKCEGFTRDGLVLVHFDGDQDADDLAGVQDQLNDLELQVADCPAMQAVNATLASGTVTISSGIVVAANSEVVPVIIGHIAGSTNFGSLGELKTSRVNGAAGVGTVVIEAISNAGGLDSDASGAIRVLIFRPTT